jgi:hypothetical protein
VTSDGSAYARFQRAVRSGNAEIALAAARELATIGLADALLLTLLLQQKGGLRFERALLRYHARFVEARPGLSVDESLVVLALLGELRGWRAPAAARALAQLLSQDEGSGVLLRWATEREAA